MDISDVPEGYVTEQVVREVLGQMLRSGVSVSHIARLAGISSSGASKTVRGVEALGLAIPRALGYERVVLYRKVKEAQE